MDGFVGGAVESGDTLVGTVGLGGFDEGNNIADFGFGADAIAVSFGDAATEDGGGALEIAEGFGEGFVAAA